jgi:hypothetical protein
MKAANQRVLMREMGYSFYSEIGLVAMMVGAVGLPNRMD